MANICDGCGESVYRTILNTAKRQWLGVECGCTKKAREIVNVNTAFAITFDHVHDEFGQKLRVENLRQLSAAEKRYGFQSVVLNADAQNFNDPPQQKPINVADVHRWKFSDRGRYEANRSRR